MHIVEAGNIMCECGNDELVFVQCLPPFDYVFSILCRKCKAKGEIEVKAETLRTKKPTGTRWEPDGEPIHFPFQVKEEQHERH